ncbi:MAG: DUF3592 domain-containing protein [Leptospiraceae bacterium]|nr:DUF3592 domain-containing protein [Leptospiraceae bacterium]
MNIATTINPDKKANSKPGVNGLGFVGMFFVFIGVLLQFVMVMEYDPLAHHLKFEGQTSQAVVLKKVQLPVDSLFQEFLPPLYAIQLQYVFAGKQVRATSAGYLSRWHWDRLQSGQPVEIYFDPRNTQDVILKDGMPSVPRDWTHFIFPSVLLLLGAVLVIFDPAILYSLDHE